MNFIKETNFDFMGQRKLTTVISLIAIATAIALLVFRGLNLGLDFTGGTLIELGYENPPVLSEVRERLTDAGYDNAVVQTFGSTRDIVVRVPPRDEEVSSADLSSSILDALRADGVAVEERRVEFVGPQIGDELSQDGGLAMLFALIGILIYVTVRFQWKFSVGSVAALVHDVILVLGMFALVQMEFDLAALAAILAVIGYSLNDTIVVYDRIRENLRMMRKGTTKEIINLSVNQMLSRTFITSLTTILVLLMLYFFGGEIIHAFAFALIIGVIVGTYSSIFVASTTSLALGVSKQDMMPVEKEGEEFDALP